MTNIYLALVDDFKKNNFNYQLFRAGRYKISRLQQNSVFGINSIVTSFKFGKVEILKLQIMAIKESNITINVLDIDRSISFYESLGLTVKTRWDNHYAQLTAPGIAIGLHPTNETNLTGNSGNVSIGFISDDFEETKSLLQKLSIKVTDRQEEGGQFLHFNDPDGTALYFIKPKW